MAIETETRIEPTKLKDTIIRPIDLQNVGFLQRESTFINCPACEYEAQSVVRLEVVSSLQRFLNFTNCFKNWDGRHDVNHYCGKCGCFIGRYVVVGCMERCISKHARRKAAKEAMALRTRPTDCAESMQRARENFIAKRAQDRAEKDAQSSRELDTLKKNTYRN